MQEKSFQSIDANAKNVRWSTTQQRKVNSNYRRNVVEQTYSITVTLLSSSLLQTP